MPRSRTSLALTALLSMALHGCALAPPPGPKTGRWIRFDAASQRYSVEAVQVARGDLLDELERLAGADVRPQPERAAPVTAQARELDLGSLVVLLLPPGTHATIRPGERDAAAVPAVSKPKEGPPRPPAAAGLAAKPDAAAERPPDRRRGTLMKTAAEGPDAEREVGGPGTKPQIEMLLRTAQEPQPKTRLPVRVERATVRLTLQFEDGAAPRLIDAQMLEGRAPMQRFVVGTYLFAVIGADGRLLQAGSFNDPLVERSYQQVGPHAVGRAKTGVVGISIAREHLVSARVQIVDMTDLPLPRELSEDLVRSALDRGRTSLLLESPTILRRLNQETRE
jgi:hypothetical protein